MTKSKRPAPQYQDRKKHNNDLQVYIILVTPLDDILDRWGKLD